MVYRFRDCDKLINLNELEDHYFYFAPMNEQNDSMEGQIEYYWNGDYIDWLCLIKNYVWQLYQSILYIKIGMDLDKFEKLFFSNSEVSKTDEEKAQRIKLEILVSHNENIVRICRILGSSRHDYNTKELKFIFFILHSTLLNVCADYFSGLNEDVYKDLYLICRNTINIENTINGLEGAVVDSPLYISMLSIVAKESELLQDSFVLDTVNRNIDQQRARFIRQQFPYRFVDAFTQTFYANGYGVSFTQGVDDCSLWGHYGDSNKGIALMFNYEIDGDIELESWDKRKKIIVKLQEVNYDDRAIRLNFFEHIGMLFGDEREHWVRDQDSMSSTYKRIVSKAKEWRTDYWKRNNNRFLHKGLFWKNERETRIIIDEYWELMDNLDKRKYYYDFNHLAGIAFGNRCATENKKQIIDIVNKMCKTNGRKDFKFYKTEIIDGKVVLNEMVV